MDTTPWLDTNQKPDPHPTVFPALDRRTARRLAEIRRAAALTQLAVVARAARKVRA